MKLKLLSSTVFRRRYISYHLYDQADKLVSKNPFPTYVLNELRVLAAVGDSKEDPEFDGTIHDILVN